MSTSSSSKAKFIPALNRRRRQGDDDDAAAAKADSVNERLARSRLAARPKRRVDPLCHPSSSSSTTSSSTPSPSASKHSFSATPSHSSQNIGVKVLSAIEAKETDRQAAAKASALRRMFAGPAPPQSWSGSAPATSSSTSSAAQTLSTSLPQPLIVPVVDPPAPLVSNALTIRPHMLTGLVQQCRERNRQVMEPWASTRPDWRPKGRLPSLKLITAAYIVDLLHHIPSAGVDDTARAANETRDELRDLPRHVKLSFMEAAGSSCLSWRPLDFTQTGVWRTYRSGLSTVHALWPGSATHSEKAGPTRNGLPDLASLTLASDEASNGSGDDAEDNWEVESPDDASNDSLADQLQVDLAWSNLPSTQARALLNPGALQNTRLRSLNIAGMKLNDDFLFHVIQYGFPNLEELCLAGCYLSRDRSLPSSTPHGRLRRLWVTCPKIKLLDLSFASPCLAMFFADGLLAASTAATSLKPPPRYATELTDVLAKQAFLPGPSDEPHEFTATWRRRCASAPILGVGSSRTRINGCSVSASHAQLREYDEDKLRDLEAARGTRAPYWTSARHAQWALLYLPRADKALDSASDFERLQGEQDVSSLPPALLPVHAPDIYQQFSDPARDYMGTGEIFAAVFRNYLGTQVDIWM